MLKDVAMPHVLMGFCPCWHNITKSGFCISSRTCTRAARNREGNDRQIEFHDNPDHFARIHPNGFFPAELDRFRRPRFPSEGRCSGIGLPVDWLTGKYLYIHWV